MAKRSAKSSVSVALLQSIASAPDGIGRVTMDEFKQHESLIVVNQADIVDGKAAAKLNDAGQLYLSNLNSNTNKEKPMYGVMEGFVPPPSQRGNRKGAGAPTVYPFESMGVGQFFFVSNTDKPDAAKKLGSTVSQQNMKYRTPTGEKETVERTKRGKGNKAELDGNGAKIKETVTVDKYKQDRKYVLRAVKKGETYGNWTAPEDGAAIYREF